MKKKISILFVLMLFFQSLSSSFALSSQDFSLETGQDVFTESSVTVEEIAANNEVALFNQNGLELPPPASGDVVAHVAAYMNPNVSTSLLGISQSFHIFANKANLKSHTNGNIAVRELTGGNGNFGANIKDENVNDKHMNGDFWDISYIQSFADGVSMQSSSGVDGREALLVLGKDIEVGTEDNGNAYSINGTKMDKFKNLRQDQDSVYIDFDTEFANLLDVAALLQKSDSKTAIVAKPDSNYVLDVSDYESVNGKINLNFNPADFGGQAGDLRIIGIPNDANLILNVDTSSVGNELNIMKKIVLEYEDGTVRNNKETEIFSDSTILWNFGAYEGLININSPFQGTILAPNTTLDGGGQNIDGSIIVNEFLGAGETHRWDYQERTPTSISISGTKTWVGDEGNEDKRPVSITVELLADGVVVDTEKITVEENWLYSFSDLPLVDADGNDIKYTIEEVEVAGYETSYSEDGFDITNTLIVKEPETTEISGEKIWIGGEEASITVNLLANGKQEDSVDITAEDDWKYHFTDLPLVDADGNVIKYTIEEVKVEGYETTYSTDGFDITNTLIVKEPETTEISGEKIWIGGEEASITVNLLANGKQEDSVDITAEDDWKYHFTDLPLVDADGNVIKYTIEEVKVEGYETTYSTDGFDITNTLIVEEPKTTEVSGEKIWVGGEEASITVNLLANGVQKDSVDVTSEDNWKYTFTDLPVVDVDGNDIEYTIEEVEVAGYETSYSTDGFDITNTLIVEEPKTTEVSGEKIWIGGEEESITVNLLANGVQKDSVDVTSEDNWKYTFTDLPVVDVDGNDIEYTIEEVEVDGYETTYEGYDIINTLIVEEPETTEISGEKIWVGGEEASITVNLLANGKQVDSIEVTEVDDWKYSFVNLPKYDSGEEIVYTITENTVENYTTEINGYDITNHYTPGETSVTVTKHWDDINNQDGIRSGSIEVQLIADGETSGDPVELSEENNWTHTWTELAEKAAGTTIVYTVEEVTEVPGYEVTVDDADHGNIIITNAYTPEEIEITGTKTWVDADNEADTRPESIIVNLLANGKQVDSIEVTEVNDWNYSFTGLAKYEAGEEIEYSVTEVKVDGYETSINGFDITNTLIPVEEPEEPEEPELGGDGGEKDPEDPTDLDGAGGEGDNLPKTATNSYNLALIGFGLMLLGLIIFLARRKRI